MKTWSDQQRILGRPGNETIIAVDAVGVEFSVDVALISFSSYWTKRLFYMPHGIYTMNAIKLANASRVNPLMRFSKPAWPSIGLRKLLRVTQLQKVWLALERGGRQSDDHQPSQSSIAEGVQAWLCFCRLLILGWLQMIKLKFYALDMHARPEKAWFHETLTLE